MKDVSLLTHPVLRLIQTDIFCSRNNYGQFVHTTIIKLSNIKLSTLHPNNKIGLIDIAHNFTPFELFLNQNSGFCSFISIAKQKMLE